MIFNSFDFAVFLSVVFILYWFVFKKDYRHQNLLLLTASYFFYGYADWRFLFLLAGMSVFNYFTGLRIDVNEKEPGKRKAWLTTGIIVNIVVLCIFKYFNFFAESFADLIRLFGFNVTGVTVKILLPLGISFYTFLSLSYLLDIYKGTMKAHRQPADVMLTLSFFPVILAGPIQRPVTLLPQITGRRQFDYEQCVSGLRQILWGLFTKVVIADNVAWFINDIFGDPLANRGSTLLLASVFYMIQIYADFSGYSNMAIGTGKLLGFNLMQNFAYPYFSRDITEFWKRWHISLTTWFRDYLFLPLSIKASGKNTNEKVLFIKKDLYIYIVASTVTWFLTGLWHGANYTFIVWGLMHGFLLIVYQWQRQPRRKYLKKRGISNDHPLIVVPETILTLLFVLMTWIFFRASNISQATGIISGIFSASLFTMPQGIDELTGAMLFSTLFFIAEWLGRNQEYAIQNTFKGVRTLRWALYYALIVITLAYSKGSSEFIYFKF